MKVNTEEAIKDLAGEAVPAKDGTFTIGKALSNIMSDAKEGGRMKNFVLAQKFYNDKEVDLDKADKELVYKAVEKTALYNNLVTGQLLLLLTDKK